jgi:outer membrane lipoprotein
MRSAPAGSLLLVVAAVMAAGCASKVPPEVREPIPGSPSLGQVRESTAAHLGQTVRWGGAIVAVSNQENVTRIEVVGRSLGSEGRPRSEDATTGRFLAEIPGFLDPAVYAQGRQITVVGPLADTEVRAIGEFPYQFPVVRVRSHYLWPRERPRQAHPPPWYHDPWYPYRSPYYPYW